MLASGSGRPQREELRLQGITRPKTGRDQSEKGDETELIMVATIISRMIGTLCFQVGRSLRYPQDSS
jgi:hypothetical protein